MVAFLEEDVFGTVPADATAVVAIELAVDGLVVNLDGLEADAFVVARSELPVDTAVVLELDVGATANAQPPLDAL